MERLWSPWRLEYILSDKGKGCTFCRALGESSDERNLILDRGENSIIMLNRYPYNNGHLMIIPNAHVGGLDQLPEHVLTELMVMINKAIAILRKAMQPDGFNVGLNLGVAAGAGIADHVHVHVVPRWDGDTNFMAVAAGTRMIPEVLADTYGRLKRCLDETEQVEGTL